MSTQLASLLTPPRTHAPNSLTYDLIHNGRIALSYYGSKFAMSFRGNRDFIDRCFAMCVNRGIVGDHAKLKSPFSQTANFAYVVIRTKEHLLRGLAAQFRSEIIMEREIAPISEKWDEESGVFDIQFDEEAIDAVATSRAAAFVREYIESDDFMARIPKSVGHTYGVLDRKRRDNTNSA